MTSNTDHLQTLLCQYRALPSVGTNPERTSLLITAIAQLAPWRITVWDIHGDACTIDSTDTPEEVLQAKALVDMTQMFATVSQALLATVKEMRRPIH